MILQVVYKYFTLFTCVYGTIGAFAWTKLLFLLKGLATNIMGEILLCEQNKHQSACNLICILLAPAAREARRRTRRCCCYLGGSRRRLRPYRCPGGATRGSLIKLTRFKRFFRLRTPRRKWKQYAAMTTSNRSVRSEQLSARKDDFYDGTIEFRSILRILALSTCRACFYFWTISV